MNDPLDQDLRAHYAALETPPTAELEARVLNAVRARSASRPSGRKLALLAACLVIAAAVGWAVRSAAPKQDPAASTPPQEPRPEEIAARVNGEAVLWKELQERFKDYKPSDVTEELRKSVRREYVERVLIRQFAARKKQVVTDDELETMVQADIRLYGSLEELERIVRIRFGTMARYREQRREEVLARKAYEYIVRSWRTDPELADLNLRTSDVPEADLRKYYEANPRQFEAIERISFMRVGVLFSEPGEEERKRALLESVLRKLNKGSEFAMMAFYYSDIRRAKDFRDLGVTRKDLEGVYTEDTIRYLFDSLKEGEISGIVRDGKSLNLFKMEQKINQKAEAFEVAREKIRKTMEHQIREENRKKTLAWLRSHAKLEPADIFGEER